MKHFLKTLIFTVLIPGTLTVYIPDRLQSRRAESSFSDYQLLGILPIAVEVGFYFWCAWDFAFAGHGTPAPIDPLKVLVSRALYRVVRNPMHVAVLLILFGESLRFASGTVLCYAVLAWLFFRLFLVSYEVPVLRKNSASPTRSIAKLCGVGSPDCHVPGNFLTKRNPFDLTHFFN